MAEELLADWPGTVARLTEVMPRDYRRVLEARAEAMRDGLDGDEVDRADHGGAPWLTPEGFLKYGREVAERRPVEERVHDWQEVYPGGPGRALLPIISTQASRCMDCGIPFCHQGCPLGNLIPEWNDLVWRDDWDGAMDRLHATNNFPEFTGRLCPAPCETACVLGINQDPVTIKNVEVAIIDRAWVVRLRPAASARVAVGPHGGRRRLGPGRARRRPAADPGRATRSRSTSGPTRSAACCATASPSSRWRSASSTAGSTRCGARARSSAPASTSAPSSTGDQLLERYDAVVLAVGVDRRPRPAGARTRARRASTRRWTTCRSPTARRSARSVPDQITAAGKHVVIIGGGDTGADCLGTAIRQGAASVTQLEILAQPPDDATRRPTRGPRTR